VREISVTLKLLSPVIKLLLTDWSLDSFHS